MDNEQAERLVVALEDIATYLRYLTDCISNNALRTREDNQ
jgi:hypothetical protein